MLGAMGRVFGGGGSPSAAAAAPAGEVLESFAPAVSIMAGEVTGEDVPVLVKVEPPEGTGRTPSSIVCVIDVSGSMRTEASIINASGVTESNGLTMLDIARHGVRTVIKALGPEDRLSVVWFNHMAGTLFELETMDEAGQKTASEKLDELTENGGTNIWLGLQQGLEELRKAGSDKKHPRLSHVMLLTDGQTCDRGSVITNLKQYQEKYEQLPGTISTFGFGYGIDSPLLVDIATLGDATYSFIPDAGFVGTVFVNTMSNLLVTMAREVFLELEPEPGCEITEVVGQHRIVNKSDGVRVILGTLQVGQSKDIVLKMKIGVDSGAPFLAANVTLETPGKQRFSGELVEGKAEPLAEPAKLEVQSHVLRCEFVDKLHDAVACLTGPQSPTELAKAQVLMKGVVYLIENSPAKDHERVKALLEDVAGQSTEALSKMEWYTRWGCHYLPSVMFAHKMQQCNNFKDAGVQVYGGKFFTEIQEKADELFNTIPAPQPRSHNVYGGGGGGGYLAPVSMAAYNDRYGACIDAACEVLLATGETRRVGELVKGDVVPGPDGTTAEVVCLLRQRCPGGCANLVELQGGCRLTPYHPVRSEDRWVFPVELGAAEERHCEAVCSLMLKGAPAVVVGGVPCVALGHGLTEGAAAHAYFGTEAVLKDLAGAPGFAQGLVELSGAQSVVRDPATGNVCGFRF